MQDTKALNLKPATSRTFAAVVEYRAYGEYWGQSEYTVTVWKDGADYRATVNGEEVEFMEAARIIGMADRLTVTAETLVTPDPAPVTIGKARAAKLHRLMGRAGLPSPAHYASAARALGREVSSLAALTEGEARTVWAYLCAHFPHVRQVAA